MSTLPVIESVNIGAPRRITVDGGEEITWIWKAPAAGRVAVRGVNLAGDDQGDRRVHGGPDKAVYAYSRDDLDWWEQQLGRRLEAGIFGENLTIAGLPVSGALIGERWRIGSAILEVSEPRLPCYKLGIRLGNATFPKQFAQAGRPGAYLRIVQEGELGANDEVIVVCQPAHDITVADVSRIRLHQPDAAYRLLEAPELAIRWHEWARKRAL